MIFKNDIVLWEDIVVQSRKSSINNIYKKFMEMLLEFISSSKWMPKELMCQRHYEEI